MSDLLQQLSQHNWNYFLSQSKHTLLKCNIPHSILESHISVPDFLRDCLCWMKVRPIVSQAACWVLAWVLHIWKPKRGIITLLQRECMTNQDMPKEAFGNATQRTGALSRTLSLGIAGFWLLRVTVIISQELWFLWYMSVCWYFGMMDVIDIMLDPTPGPHQPQC